MGRAASGKGTHRMQESATEAVREAYAKVAYWSLPHHNADPNRIAAVARLHGIEPPDPRRARVLELGGGDGGNSLAIAAAWPEAHCTCYDLSDAAIERGRGLAERAKLTNVELRAADLLELPEHLGEFDYVVLHGLITWVPDPVRDAALRIAAASLAPGGLVMCDYNALPGWAFWTTSRALLLEGAASCPSDDPSERIAHARRLVQLARELNGSDSLHAQLLAITADRVDGRTDSFLFHDDMNPSCTPYWLEDVTGFAAAVDLHYVGELRTDQWWEADPVFAAQIRAVAGHDDLLAQRYADLVRGPQFKATVFASAETTAARTGLDMVAATSLVVCAEDLGADELSTGEWSPAERGMLGAVVGAGAPGVAVGDAARAAGLDEELAGHTVLGLAYRRVLGFRLVPAPAASRVPDRPQVHPLVLAQCGVTQVVSRLVHDYTVIDDPLATTVLQLLDGVRTTPQIVAEIAARLPGVDTAELEKDVSAVLDRFASEGLLMQGDGDAARD